MARRKGAPTDVAATIAPLSTGKTSTGLGANGGGRVGGRTPVGGPRAGSSAEVQHLTTQVTELNAHLEGLEKERDFYFSKVSMSL